MRLEDQVCSLEHAKRLKELGVKQDSLFYWSICHDCEKEYPAGTVQWELSYETSHGENISAFTVAELGEMIPPHHYNFYKNDVGYIFSLFGEPNTIDSNLANCMAKMLIYLIENGLLKNELST